MLGWRTLEKGEYKLEIPNLSEQEKLLVLASYEHVKELARVKEVKTKEEGHALISQAITNCAVEQGFYVEKRQLENLSKIALMHLYGFGFMEQLIEDNDIEEISIIGPEKPAYVYVRNQGWKSVNFCFENDQAIGEMINKMGKGLGRHITLQNPRLDAILPNGSRFHASLPPISKGEITIRKFRQHPFSPKELCSVISLDGMALVSMIMQCDFNLIIAGNTASGKTTTMNSLFSFVPANERILITEETPEINIPHQHQLRLVANKEMGIGLGQLIYDSLRMRPDRMIIGEVRNNEEVESLFDVMLAGQARGSYATFHAQSTEEFLRRLGSFGIKREDLDCVDCVIIQRRIMEYDSQDRQSREKRKVMEIAEIADGKPSLFYRNEKLDLHNSKIVEKICSHFTMDKEGIKTEMEFRKKLIQNAPLAYDGFFEEVQAKLYGGGHD